MLIEMMLMMTGIGLIYRGITTFKVGFTAVLCWYAAVTKGSVAELSAKCNHCG